MIDAILRAARVSDSYTWNAGKFMWHHVVLYISRLFEKRSPTSINRVITLISPYVPWRGALNSPVAVSRWAAAAPTIPYTEEVGQNVIDALLQIAFMDFLRPHIPIEIWMWLKRRPTLPPVYRGLKNARHVNTVAYVRRLGDIDLLKSYFLFAWTEQWVPLARNYHEMETSIREDFGGIGMEHHRRDLVERLDHIIGELYWAAGCPESPQGAGAQYQKLKDILLEFDRR